MPTLLKTTDFAQAGPVSAVGAGLVLYDNWRDRTGNQYSIANAAPNSRLSSGTSGAQLYHATLASVRDVRVVFHIDGPANHNIMGVRMVDDGTGKPSDNGYLIITDASSLGIQFNSPATGTAENLNVYNYGTTGPIVVVFEAATTATNTTTFKLKVFPKANWDAATNPELDPTVVAGATLNQTLVDVRNTAGANFGRFQSAGWAAIRQAKNLIKVSFVDIGVALARPTLIATNFSQDHVDLSITPSGGSPPYTVRYHATTAVPRREAPIAKDSSTEVAGQTGNGSNSLSYNFPDATPRYVIAKVTDAAAATVYSNLIRVAPAKRPLAVIFAGDSFTQGVGGIPWNSCDTAAETLRTLYGPRWVAYSNKGFSQTTTDIWLPLADTEYSTHGLTPPAEGLNALVANTIASMKSLYPEAKVVVSWNMGINDAMGYNDPALAPSGATFAARLQRIFAPWIAAGVDHIIMQSCSFVASQIASVDDSNGGTGSYRAYFTDIYKAASEGIANGTTILVGDSTSFDVTGMYPQELGNAIGWETSKPAEGHPRYQPTGDGVQAYPDGWRTQGVRWAAGILKALNQLPTSGTPGRPFASRIFGG